MMRSLVLSAAIALIGIVPAVSDDVPFAAPPPPGQPETSNLADLMSLVQMRHIKIWYAGKAKNWDLLRFELTQIEASLDKAAVRYVNIPVEFILKATKPLDDMREAAAAKDSERFTQAYSELTAACNSCHTAGSVGFIHIQNPTASPFSDQAY